MNICHLLARLYESTGRAIAVTPASALASALASAFLKMLKFLLARLHKVHIAIVVTSVVPVYVYVRVRVTLSVKVFYKSVSLDHVDGSS